MIAHKLNAEVAQQPRILAAVHVCQKLHDAGWQALWVGGCVRDLLLKPELVPGDIDIATNASFEVVRKLFPGTIAIGKAFGVGLVNEQGFAFEVAAFRKESDYADRRHPSKVGPGTLEEDSARRDFTINSLYFDPLLEQIIDFHSGLKDLQNRQLKCVGDASQRLHEDPLRILRLYRFAANLNFEIEAQTLAMAESLSGELVYITRERVLLEISKIKHGTHARFQKHLAKIQSHLLENSQSSLTPQTLSTQSPRTLSAPAEAAEFPGTLLALMCLQNEGAELRDWRKVFKNWPFSVHERAHLELMCRSAVSGFMIPADTAFSITDSSTLSWLEHCKWLFRQNRVALSETEWIVQNIPCVHDSADQIDLLRLISDFFKNTDTKRTMASALEQTISQSAKKIRDQLQDWSKQNPKEALGWARLLGDLSVLMDKLKLPETNRPSLFATSHSTHLQEICAAALTLSRISASKNKTH